MLKRSTTRTLYSANTFPQTPLSFLLKTFCAGNSPLVMKIWHSFLRSTAPPGKTCFQVK